MRILTFVILFHLIFFVTYMLMPSDWKGYVSIGEVPKQGVLDIIVNYVKFVFTGNLFSVSNIPTIVGIFISGFAWLVHTLLVLELITSIKDSLGELIKKVLSII